MAVGQRFCYFAILVLIRGMDQAIGSFCPPGYSEYNGVCYGVHDASLNFTEAESQCNQLPGGHLAAFYSAEEYQFLQSLTNPVCGGGCNVWVGLTRTDGVWMFTDGSTYDYVPPDEWFNGDDMPDMTPQDCARLIPKVSDIWCSADSYDYICMVHPAHISDKLDSIHIVAQSNVVNSTLVIDDDKNSCLDESRMIYPADDFYYMLLQMTVKDADDLTGTIVRVDVVFNQAIVCSGRQVVYIAKEEDGCLRAQPCTLTTGVLPTATVDCIYACSCDVRTCDVILFDRTNETEKICEISMSPTIN